MRERAILIPSGPLQLEGLLSLPEESPAGGTPALPASPIAGVVICHPHPLRGGDMHNTVVAALASGLAQQGFATLRFNYQGVGASQGSYDEGRGEQQDARAALRFLAERVASHRSPVGSRTPPSPSPLRLRSGQASPRGRGEDPELATWNPKLALAGYSFGAGVALAVAADEPLVGALIAVSPPTARLNPAALQRPDLPKLFISGSADPIAQAGPLQEAVRLLPPPVACHVAAGEDHFWWGHEGWIVQRVLEFLGGLPKP